MAEAPIANAPVATRSKWLKAALIASLALNVLVIGAVAGAAWRFRSPGFANAQFGPANIMSYLSDLPAERRTLLWNETTEPRRALGPLRRAVRAARRDAYMALSAEPFQPTRYLDAQTRFTDTQRDQQLAAAKLFADVAGRLTPDERRAFIRWRDRRVPPHERSDAPDQDNRPEAPPK
jgi:uncharacterized membrane protein